MTRRRLSVLLLADDNRDHAETVLEHIAALRTRSRHRVRVFNPRGLPSTGVLDLEEFDAVVIHYTLAITYEHYLPVDLREKLHRFGGPKLQFIQDDYRWVDEMTAMMRYLGIDVLFTLVPEREIPNVWSENRLPGVEKIQTLAGYVSERLARVASPPLEQRPFDVGYRGRTLPYWLGRLAQEKALIAKGFLERAPRHGLRCNIAWAEDDRIYGAAWVRFIASCRTTLGTESGASITDFDGRVEREVKEYLERHPRASFEEVFDAVLHRYEGNVWMNVISPRIFEAAALRTPLVLFPGEYGGVIERDRHYVGLEKDFSNFDEVVERIRDVPFLAELRARVYEEVVASGRYTYENVARQLDDALADATPRGIPAAPVRYWRARAAARVARSTRSGRVIAQTPPARAIAEIVVPFRIVAPVPELRRVLFARLRSRAARRTVKLRDVVRDLTLLGVIRRAQRLRLNAGEGFRVDASVDPSGRLALRSERYPTPVSTDAVDRVDVSRGIVWHHLAQSVPFAVTRRHWVAIPIGQDRAHAFDAITALALFTPEVVERAVRDVVAAKEQPPSRFQVALTHWLLFATIVATTLAQLAPGRGLSWVPVAVARARLQGRPVDTRSLATELFRVAQLLRDAAAGTYGVVASHHEGVVTLRSVADVGGAPEVAAPERVDRLVWDHSRVARTLDLYVPRRGVLTVTVGDSGVFTPRELSTLAAIRPRQAWSSLVRATRARVART